MRRGHPNVGGWRGEKHRHNFRPRNPGTPHFRPSRPYGQSDTPRYFVSNSRPYRPMRPYNSGPRHASDAQSDRNPYRINNVRPKESEFFTRERPTHQRDQDHGSYGESNMYQHLDRYHINSMGDTDQRRSHHMQNTDTFSQNPWANHPPSFEYTKQYYEERNAHKTPRRYNMSEEMPLPDYSGHRPPASDHYTATSANNNNSQFTHSVDDTVDIVRKRLMNKDKQQDPVSPIHQSIMDEDLRTEPGRNYQSPPRETPVKKKTPRQKQNIKVNCDKMKNKIVHQLFKMDKSKIHKLMDNPSSSSKFEYAISTLITEGQNSLNRHMRSVAEKSLYSSSSDFIQNDSNTIYEDTFMKQMQAVLDPQDTILLEDIKPLVMAELSRVLQLDDYQFDGMQQQSSFNKMEPGEYSCDKTYNSEQYTESHNFNQNQESFSYDKNDSIDSLYNRSNEDSSFESKPLFERRQKQNESYEERRSIESRVSNHSMDHGGYLDKPKSPCEQPLPLFDPNTDTLSDDDDYPFAELDKQYHVAVDHNFIESVSCAPSPQHSIVDVSNDSFSVSTKDKNEVPYKSPTNIKYEINVQLPDASSVEIEKEIDTQLQNMANSPVKLLSNNVKTEPKAIIKSGNEVNIKTESKIMCNKSESEINQKLTHGTEDVIHEESTNKEKEENHGRVTNSNTVLQSNTRKRSTDQKPSHRKEKRKKSSKSECQEAANSIVNMFFSNDDHKHGPKDYKKSNDKTYSDKYVKRKNIQKKPKEKLADAPKVEESKKINSNTSHSILSPKNSISQDTPNKADAKLKLKHIDMFVEQPKKPGSIHLSRRNTTTTSSVKSPDDSKPKTIVPTPPITSFCRKLIKRHVGTQMVLKQRHRDCQTLTPRQCVKATQTEPIKITSLNVAINPLERMKEIDMEIQVLLQEKFKLYNSIESKSKSESIDTIPSLSMRIFNVAQPEESSQDSEDAIVDDFTSIPTEELEEIALETFEKSPPKEKRNRRNKVMELPHKPSKSPTTKRNKKAKAPNISLIEQIITDDRPIEDIISLDAFETTPIKIKKTYRPTKKKAMKKSKAKVICASYDIKPCFVALERIDISQYLRPKQSPREIFVNNVEFQFEVPIVEMNEKEEAPNVDLHKKESECNEVVEDDNLQFDMLDVSEDIIIGDNVEVKLDKSDEKTLTEDIILDNSQSSLEDGASEPVATEMECKMYDYSTNENLRRDAITVTGNADAVLAIECIENDFIAACLDGNVYHFNGDGVLLNTLRGSNLAVTCLTIVKEKYGTTVYTGSLDSRIRYYDLETGMEKGPECNVLSPIQTMDRAWDTVFVGTRTGFVLQFECKNNMLIPVSTVKFSEQSILALRALKEGPRKVLLVAARSENVTVRDAQTGLLLRSLVGPKMTVYTLLFEDGKVYCGTSSHSIHVFDYASGGHVGTHEGGKGAVCLRARAGLVFAGCYDGCVYIYREGEMRPLAHLRGPSPMLLSLAVRGTKIIAGYKDRSLYIWKIPAAILQEMVL